MKHLAFFTITIAIFASTTGSGLFVSPVHATGPPIVFINPVSAPLSPQGTTVQFDIKVGNMPDFTGFDVHVSVGDHTVLNPTSITPVENFGGSGTPVANCVNGIGTACDNDDGAGVAHLAISAIGGSDNGNVTLFSVSYKSSSSDPNAFTFLSLVNVNIADISGAKIQNVIVAGASYGNVTNAPQAVFTWSPVTPYAGDIITLNASQSFDPLGGKIVHYDWSCFPECGDLPVVLATTQVGVGNGLQGAANITITLVVRNSNGLKSNPVAHIIHLLKKIVTDVQMYTLSMSQYSGIVPGTKIQVSPLIRNSGNTPVSLFNVTIKINDRVLVTDHYDNTSRGGPFTQGQLAPFGPYVWNTTGYDAGTYTVTAIVSNVFGDNNTRDKSLSIDVTIREPVGASSLIPVSLPQFAGIVVGGVVAVGAAFYMLGRRRDKRRRLLQEAL